MIEPTVKKNILVLTPRLPYPVIGGDKLRIYNICRFLHAQGYSLTLISFVIDLNEEKLAKSHPDNSIFDKIITVNHPVKLSFWNSFKGLFSEKPIQNCYYHSSRMQEVIDAELEHNQYHFVLAHLIRMAPYIEKKDVYKILEMTDAISLNYKRNSAFKSFNLLGLVYKIETNRVLKYERRCIEAFHSVVVVSDIDKNYLKDNSDKKHHAKIKTISNGVSDNFLKNSHNKQDQNLVVFIGNLRSYQNSDGILYFINECWPSIHEIIPEATLKVIGANPPKSLLTHHKINNVLITGEVDSVLEEAKNATVSVAPIRIGAGIQNKVLESMALSVPVVSTPIAAEGIDGIEPDKNILIGDNAKELSDAVIRLLYNPEEANKIGENGKQIVQDLYSWDERLKEYPHL